MPSMDRWRAPGRRPRIVARIPDRFSFPEAAPFPIGGLTAREALFGYQATCHPRSTGHSSSAGPAASDPWQRNSSRPGHPHSSSPRRRIPNRGSRARRWEPTWSSTTPETSPGSCRHRIDRVELVLSTAATAGNLGWITAILRPFGHLSAVDLAGPIDTGLLTPKSISLHTEMVFRPDHLWRSHRQPGADP